MNADIEMGRDLVKLLDEVGYPVTGAAWIYYPENDAGRLVIGTPRAERDLLGALRELADAMDAKGDLRARLDLSRVKLVSPKDRILAAMASVMRVDGLADVRFARSMINGTLIDDALIYRLAA